MRPAPDLATLHSAVRELGYQADGAVASFQRDWDLEPTGAFDRETIVVVMAALQAHRIGEQAHHPHPNHAVKGTVASTSGESAPGLGVQLVEQAFRSETTIASGSTDPAGHYAIAYPRAERAGVERNAIFVRVLDGETVVAQSPLQFLPGPLLSVDLVVDASHVHAPTEYERLVADVQARIGSVAIADLTEDAQRQDVSFLSGATSWPTPSLTRLIVSARLRALSSIDRAFFYAVLGGDALLGADAAKLGMRAAIGLSTPVQPLFYEIVLLDPAWIKSAVASAVADRTVPAAVGDELDGTLSALAASRSAAQAFFTNEQPRAIVAAVAANVVSGKSDAVRALLAQHGHGDPVALAAALQAIGVIKPTSGEQARGVDPALLAELQTLLPAWPPTDGAAPNPQQGTAPTGGAAGSPQPQAPPVPPPATAAFAADLAATPGPPGLPHRDAIAAFLAANPTFDLATGNVDRQLAVAAAAGTAADPQLRAALKATQRVFKLTDTHGQTAALLAAGVHSAAQIAAIGRGQFVKRFTGDGTFTEPEAAAAFQRAHAVHVAATFLAGELRSLSGAALTAAVAPGAAAKLSLVSRDNPNLRNLFPTTDQCACDSCRDITSPSAYLVDVIEFLRHRTVVDTTAALPVPNQTARDVLFARRPDLADIDLSCDNANVPLPYIDVVCELLEEAIAPDQGFSYVGPAAAGAVPPALQAAGFPFTAAAFTQEADLAGCLYARDATIVCKLTPAGPPDSWTVRRLRQTSATAAELAAAPEYVDDAAYVTLQAARTAFHLPFDLFYAEAEAYFAQFGVGREDLMRALAAGGAPAPRVIAAQVLGLSDAERSLIVTPDAANQAVYWNTGAADPATVVNVVDSFLTRAELEYADLEGLLQLQFINPAGTLFIDHLDSSCDATNQVIAGLDDAALDRIHRFLRLQRRLAWPPAVLDQAIMAPRLGNGQLDDALVVYLADLAALQRRLALDIGEIVGYYGLIPADGPQSRYAQLFLNPAANGSVAAALQVAAVQANEALPPGSQQHLGDVAAALAVALGVTTADLTALSTAMAAPPHGDDVLSLANLALLYAQLSLARSLGCTVSELLSLAHMTSADALASPAATLAFAVQYDRIRGAGITAARLRFLLGFEAPDLPALALADSVIGATLTRIQAQLQTTHEANRSPFDPGLTADENKAALGDVISRVPGVAQAQLSAVQAIVDGSYAGSVPAHQVLSDILGTVADAATVTSINALQLALATTPPAPPGPFETARLALIEALTAAVSGYLYGTARNAAVVAAVAAGLPADPALCRMVLSQAHLVITGQPRTLLAILGDDSLIDLTHLPPVLPAITAAAFPDQWAALRLANQITLFAATIPLNTDDIGWLLSHAGALGWLQLEQLPYQPGMTAIPLSAWDQLQDAIGLLRWYPPVTNPASPRDPLTMRGVFTLALPGGGAGPPLLDLLAGVTGWDRGVLADLDARFGFSVGSPSPYLLPATYLRLETAVIVLRKLGISVADGASLIVPVLGPAAPATLRLALKARYSQRDWLGVLKQVYDPLREQKRDALVAFLLAANLDFTSSDDLFDYFLVDVEMSACQPTSRIVSAHGTLQLFVQRCLMAVEPTAVADVADDDGWTQWSWMSAYRVWQANPRDLPESGELDRAAVPRRQVGAVRGHGERPAAGQPHRGRDH